MTSAGSVLTVVVTGHAGGFLGVDAIQESVAAELVGAGLTVRNIRVTSNANYSNPASWVSWDYRAVVVVQTAIDYAGPDAVGDLVALAFADQTGDRPFASATVNGGSIIPEAPAEQGSIGDSLSAIVSTLHMDAIGLVVIVGGLLALAVVAIGWGKGNVISARI